jgi:hypothetical protein
MIKKFKFATVLAVAFIGTASPVFAQSFDQDFGTGNVLWNNQGVGVSPLKQAKIHHNGVDALAMEPNGQLRNQIDQPANTGGGSLGYNDMLRTY